MLELYSTYHPTLLIVLVMLSSFVVILQAYHSFSMSGSVAAVLFEGLIACHAFLISLNLRVINGAVWTGQIILPPTVPWRWAVIALLVPLGLYLFWTRRVPLSLPALVSVAITAPWAEALPYGIFSIGLVLSQTLLAARAIICFCADLGKRQKMITGYSIKEALDSQHNGILFFEEDGNILLVNRRMLQLMEQFTGINYRSGTGFWRALEQMSVPLFSNHNVDVPSGLLYTQEGESWQFVRQAISVKSRVVYQVIATEVSEQQMINEQLDTHGRLLLAQQDELNNLLLNMERLRKEEVLSNSWDYLHGVLGQRISILQRHLRQSSPPDKALLGGLVAALRQDLELLGQEQSGFDYEAMLGEFKELGINVHQIGNLPRQERIAQLFTEIVREAIANALRHGDARNIYIEFSDAEQHFLTVTNDGILPPALPKWGGGLRGIEQKVAARGGNFELDWEERFAIKVKIPRQNNPAAEEERHA